ncbi:MAG: putative Na+/H+ antiporter [Pseudodesulfovibrio sp.]
MRSKTILIILIIATCAFSYVTILDIQTSSASEETTLKQDFPRPLDEYGDSEIKTIIGKLTHRIAMEPFNLVATLLFLFAIIHTFLSSKFLELSQKLKAKHQEKIQRNEATKDSVNHYAEALLFLGDVETVFGIWAIALVSTIVLFFNKDTAVNYLTHSVNFTEAFFIIVIMALASSRPILKLSENIVAWIADKLGGTVTAWWFTILTLGPLLGSLITEPAAMTISALLLAEKFYVLNPSNTLKYATIGLLFVSTSIGGTLTNFAAPPVLMVAGPWDWDTLHMLTYFGWKSVIAICICNAAYYFMFLKEFKVLQGEFKILNIEDKILAKHLSRREMEFEWDTTVSKLQEGIKITKDIKDKVDAVGEKIRQQMKVVYLKKLTAQDVDTEMANRLFNKRFAEVKLFRLRRELPFVLSETQRAAFKDPEWNRRTDPVPIWVTLVHIGFMVWTIANAHYPAMFVPGLLFYLAFSQVTSPYQNKVDLKSPLLVGFFLGGLVIHGGVQGWWIEPVLGSLAEVPLMLTATALTAVNDNAAITYLSTLVPSFTEGMKYAVVAGAVSGGGLTVIANAPNPAGQSILKGHFENGVSPSKLFLAALGPTIIVELIFLLTR